MINHMNRLGGVEVGRGRPVRIMGILNASPESFYKKSVRTSVDGIRDAVLGMERDGADFADVGGMSTAPYLRASTSEGTESRRVVRTVRAIREVSDIPVSVDTCRASVARAALECGADIVNDVSGLKFDSDMPGVIAEFKPSLVLGAYGTGTATGDLVEYARSALGQSVKIARDCGVPAGSIVLDPAIGFFRRSGSDGPFTRIRGDWTERDILTVRRLEFIGQGRPVLVSVSNKSFLGKMLGHDAPADRLYGSVAAEAVAVINGADIIRTHNVAQTRDAVTVASGLSGRI